MKSLEGDKSSMPEPSQTKTSSNSYCAECCIGVLNKFPSRKTLDMLPIEIIEKVLEFLSPNDLARMSVTCRRFRDAARNFFQLKRQCGTVTITSNRYDAHADFRNEKNIHIIRFRSLIPRVVINLFNDKSSKNALTLVKDNCCKHLKSLSLHAYNHETKIYDLDLNMIAEHIKSIEILDLCKINSSTIDWELFFNLRTLSILLDHKITFMNRTFPKLQTLCLFESVGYNNLIYERCEFDVFLRNNAQLKNIYCNHRLKIQWILSTVSKLSNVVLVLYGEKLFETLNDLEECSNRKNIESIDVSMGPLCGSFNSINKLERFGPMTQVKSLHFTYNSYHDICFGIISLPYVSSFYDRRDQEYFNEIFRFSQNLEELRLYIYGIFCVPVKDMISFIISVLPRLKYLYVYGFKRREIQEDLIKEWDTVRSSLEKAPHLAIEFGFKQLYLDAFMKGNYISVSTVTSRERFVLCSICCNSLFDKVQEYMAKLT